VKKPVSKFAFQTQPAALHLGNLMATAGGAATVGGAAKKGAKKPSAGAAEEEVGGGGLINLMSGLMSGGGNSLSEAVAATVGTGAGKQKCSYTWGAAEAMGPREYMEDAWCVKDSGFAGGYFYASVMDGHGGGAASAYLRWGSAG
jgi:protein phosphatase 1A